MQPNKLKLISREFSGFERSFAAQAAHFTRLRPEWGIDCEFEEIHRLYNRMVKGREAEQGDYDLFLCVSDWLPEAIRGQLLVPLDEFLEQDPPEDWPDAWSPSMRQLQTGEDGKVYGIAYHDGPEMLLYRNDLFEDPLEQETFRQTYGYELKVPVTWDEFLDAARFFTRPERNLHGALIAAYPDGHNNVYDFLIHLWSRGGELVTKEWEPAFHGTAGEEALQYYVDLLHKHKVVPEESLKMDSVKSGDYFAQGGAAMMWNWCGFAAVAEMPGSKVAGNVKTGLIPRGDGPVCKHMSLNIYWVLGIPFGSKNKEAAYQFIKEAASAEMDKLTSMSGGNGTRLSTWRDVEVRSVFSYYEHIEEVHRNVNSPLPIPEYPAINDVLSRMVDDAVNLRKTVRRALEEASAKVGSILKEGGYR
ncbi:extracellular solute-binding protein [Paenibacillus tarimensis]